MNSIITILLLCAALLPSRAQIPVLDENWTVTVSNSARMSFVNGRSSWSISIGSTNPPPPAPVLPAGPTNLWNLIYTNLIAHTNGRSVVNYSTNIWTGTTTAPTTVRNTNAFIYGAEGFTAFSVHNTAAPTAPEFGQIQATLLTRRHAMIRGHGTGAQGVPVTNGVTKVFFLTSSNTSVEATVRGQMGFAGEPDYPAAWGFDYTILLFSADVPDSIEPLDCILETDFNQYLSLTNPAARILYNCQHNYTSTPSHFSLPSLVHNSYIGGDSGSADLVLLPAATNRFRLALWGIRSGSRFSTNTLNTINTLTEWAGLSTNTYQPTVVNFEDYLP